MVFRLGAGVFVVAVAAAGCATQSAQGNPDADRTAINALRDQFIAAYRAGDPDRVTALYEENATVMPHDQPTIVGRSEIAKHERDSFGQVSVGDVQIKSDKLQIMGDWAYDRGTFSVTITPKGGGGPMTDTGRYLVVLHRQADGSWKAAEDIDNGETPRMPPPSAPIPPTPPTPPQPKK